MTMASEEVDGVNVLPSPGPLGHSPPGKPRQVLLAVRLRVGPSGVHGTTAVRAFAAGLCRGGCRDDDETSNHHHISLVSKCFADAVLVTLQNPDTCLQHPPGQRRRR